MVCCYLGRSRRKLASVPVRHHLLITNLKTVQRMFKNKSKESPMQQSTATSANGSTNTLTNGTSVEGKINANSDIRIDGTLKGSLSCKGRVIIGPQGYIEGDISCQNAIIEGKFSGELTVYGIIAWQPGRKRTWMCT